MTSRLLTLLASLLFLGCASTRFVAPPSAQIVVLPAIDRVPVRDATIWLGAGEAVSERKAATLRTLSGILADALAAGGARVCESEVAVPETGAPDPVMLAALGLAEGADVVVLPEFVAYGQVRRSWVWLLAGQGLLAGVGHGAAAAEVTGRSATGWWVGLGEFAVETITWVGGALVASRVIDPVIVRVWVVDCRSGVLLKRVTLEGTRPLSHWLKRTGEPPRAVRLRAVADRLFAHAAPRLLRKIGNARPDLTTRGNPNGHAH